MIEAVRYRCPRTVRRKRGRKYGNPLPTRIQRIGGLLPPPDPDSSQWNEFKPELGRREYLPEWQAEMWEYFLPGAAGWEGRKGQTHFGSWK